MTAPVATLAARFTADGSETVRRAIASVTKAASEAAAVQGKAAAAAAQKVTEAQIAQRMEYRRTIEAAERAAYAEQAARTKAAAAMQRTMSQVSTQTSNRFGQMALSAASSFNAITWSGKVSGEALKNIFQQTALVGATMFGAGGPIVAAVAVSALAITNLITGARAEQKRALEEAKRDRDRMVDAGDVQGLTRDARTIFEGTAKNEFKDGLGKRLERLGLSPFATVEAIKREIEVQNRLAKVRVAGARERFAELQALVLLREKYDDLTASILSTANALRDPRTVAPITASVPQQAQETVRRLRELPGGRSASSVGDRPNTGGAVRVPLPDATEIVTATQDELIAEFTKRQSTLSQGIAATIGGGIAAGISAAIMSGDVGTAIKSIGTTVLAGLGDIFAQIAAKAIAQATLMTKFMAFLTANPIAAVAVAVSMMALARSMGGGRGASGVGAGVGSFGGAGRVAAGSATESVTRLIFGNNSVATAAGMTPRQANHFTVIGPNDPSAQRAIADIVKKAEGRGLLAGMG